MRPVILFAIYSVAFAGVTLVRGTAGANDPAHELAQKFAVGDQATPAAAQTQASKPELNKTQLINPQPIQAQPAKPQLKTQVAAPAPAAAAPKPKAQAQVQVQTVVQTQAQAQTPAAPQAAAAPPAAAPTAATTNATAPKPSAVKPRPPAPGPDYERDMLDAARAEAESRQQPQTKQAESAPPPATAPAAAAQPSATVAAPAPPAAAPAQPAAQAAPAPVPAQTATPPPAQAPAVAPAPAAPPQIKIEAKVHVPAPAAAAVVARPEGAPRATILAVLTHHARDTARPITPPDPVICLADICYISAGPNADAKLVSRADALSTKNTVTSGAGACKGMSRCAFRGVSMKPGNEVQIIDLGIVGHGKREPADVLPDKSCHVDDGDLVCEHPVTAPDYRIWVVPETIAASAGPGALEAALNDDLPEEDIARVEDK